MPTEINGDATLSTQVVLGFSKKQHIDPQSLLLAQELDKKYRMAEAIDADALSLEDIDLVVALSGRGDFSGQYAESGNKYAFSADAFDPKDTINRVHYAVSVAKKCMRSNQEHHIKNQSTFISMACRNKTRN